MGCRETTVTSGIVNGVEYVHITNDAGDRVHARPATLAEGKLLKDRGSLVEACRPFVSFLAHLEALEELGDVGPLGDGQSVCHAMGGGGPDAITVGQLRALRDAVWGAGGGPEGGENLF